MRYLINHQAHLKKGGDPQKSGVYKACAAENFRKIGVKSTVLELQKTYRYKSSSLINFQTMTLVKIFSVPQKGGGGRPPTPFLYTTLSTHMFSHL